MGKIAKIELTQGKFSIVDYKNLPRICNTKWTYDYKGYAFRRFNGKSEFLHRAILGLSHNDGIIVDHKNGDGLDNRESNLRLCSHAQNIFNSKKKKNCSSKYKGVSFSKRDNKWYCQIRINGVHYWKGFFDSEEIAALEYNKLAAQYHGEFARLNPV